MLAKTIAKNRRHKRLRARVVGSADRPRVSVYRSSKHIYAQIIDDSTKKTLVSMSDMSKEFRNENKTKKRVTSKSVGIALAGVAKTKKIKNVVFDRGGLAYSGRVKALAEGLREGGLEF